MAGNIFTIEGELTLTHRPYEGVDVKIDGVNLDELLEKFFGESDSKPKRQDQDGYTEAIYGQARVAVEVTDGR